MGSAVAVAIGVGVAIAVQVGALGHASHRLNPLAVALMLQVGGLAFGVLWALGKSGWSELGAVGVQWWWLPLGGVGWVVLAALAFASTRIGVASTLAISVTAQLLVGLVVDVRGGLANIGIRPALGAILLVGGLYLVTARG